MCPKVIGMILIQVIRVVTLLLRLTSNLQGSSMGGGIEVYSSDSLWGQACKEAFRLFLGDFGVMR
jgi:hypothetical protein